MTKIEDTIKEIWNKEPVRDATIITGVTVVEQVTENVLLRQVQPKYHKWARAIINAGSNTLSYFLGKSQQEKYGQKDAPEQNGQS